MYCLKLSLSYNRAPHMPLLEVQGVPLWNRVDPCYSLLVVAHHLKILIKLSALNLLHMPSCSHVPLLYPSPSLSLSFGDHLKHIVLYCYTCFRQLDFFNIKWFFCSTMLMLASFITPYQLVDIWDLLFLFLFLYRPMSLIQLAILGIFLRDFMTTQAEKIINVKIILCVRV